MTVSVALALAGLAGAAFLFGGESERVERLRLMFSGLHRLLSAKYFVDEAYAFFIGRPLIWISERVFLNLGDRKLLDGSLNGMAAMGQRTAGVLARVQTGSLHLYALLVVMGIVATVLWSWRHG